MNHKDIEQKFSDIIDSNLPEAELQELLGKIEGDPELKQSFSDFQKVLQMEAEIADEQHQLHENFVVQVMNQLEGEGSGLLRSLIMQLQTLHRNSAFLTAAVTCSIALICIQLLGKSDDRISKNQTIQLVEQDKINQKLPQSPAEQQSSRGIVVPIDQTQAKQGSENKPAGLSGDGDSAYLELKKAADEKRQDNSRIKAAGDSGVELREAQELISSSSEGHSIERQVPAPAPQAGVVAPALSGKTSVELSSKGLQAAPQGIVMQDQLEEWNTRTAEVFPEPIHQMQRGLDESAPGYSLPFHDKSRVQIPNTERYGQWVENARTLARETPVSTFSIDVDTGSYTNARRFLQMGQLPPADSVRIEEFINYFKYSYPVQTEKPFTFSYEIAPSPLSKGRHLLKLGIKARDSINQEKPWNLVFLVDVSGSMADANKLELVKQSLRVLTNNMRSGDRVALVTYAGYAEVALPSTGIENKSRILAAIDQLGAGGSTHGSAGIMTAYQIAEQARISNGVNRVILATDGDFNVGVTDQNALIDLIEQKRKTGITLTTLGFGTGNYNEAMMEQIANKGNGNYFYIDSFKEARKVFETDLLGTIEVVAKDVKLQIEFNPDQVLEYRLVGYENRKLREEDFNNDSIDAGEIGSGHTVTALYELVLADTPDAAALISERRYANAQDKPVETANKQFSAELAFLKIRHKAPDADISQLMSFPLEKQHVQKDFEQASPDFRFAAAVSMFAGILRKSQYANQLTISEVLQIAERAQGQDANGLRAEFVQLVKNARALER